MADLREDGPETVPPVGNVEVEVLCCFRQVKKRKVGSCGRRGIFSCGDGIDLAALPHLFFSQPHDLAGEVVPRDFSLVGKMIDGHIFQMVSRKTLQKNF